MEYMFVRFFFLSLKASGKIISCNWNKRSYCNWGTFSSDNCGFVIFCCGHNGHWVKEDESLQKKKTDSNKKLAGFLTPCSLGCRWNSFFITENTRHFRSETPGQVGPQHKLCCNPREINYWYMFQFYSFLLEELVYKKNLCR